MVTVGGRSVAAYGYLDAVGLGLMRWTGVALLQGVRVDRERDKDGPLGRDSIVAVCRVR